MFGFEGTADKEDTVERYLVILDSSMVEHSAVNRVVVGSSPTRGVKNSLAKPVDIAVYRFLCILSLTEK